MGACWVKTKKLISDFLVYDTVSVVRIKDKRLALLHYACLIAILIYILIYTVWYKQAYYAYESPVGTVRINPMAPPERKERWRDIPDIPYCRFVNETMNRTSLNGFDLLNCKYYDSAIDVFPQAVDSSITIASRIKFSTQTSNNTEFDTPDTTWNDDENSTEIYYLADIERFTLQIDHTFFAPTLDIQGNARQMVGSIINSSDPDHGEIKERYVPDIEKVGEINVTDIISVGTLLHAAGVDIDATSVLEGESIRYSGAIFLVIIDYQNSRDLLFRPNTHYTISVQLMNSTEYKAVQAVYTKKLVSRTIYNRHALHFVFLQTGKLVKFNFQVLLLSLVSGMGMLAFSTLITDFISTKLLGSKEVVSSLKYRTTTNLTQLSDEQLTLLAHKLRRTQEQELAINSADDNASSDAPVSVVTLRQPLIDKADEKEDD